MKTLLTFSLLLLISFTGNANASSANAQELIRQKQARAMMLNKEAGQRVEYLRANRNTPNVESSLKVETFHDLAPASGNKIENKEPEVTVQPANQAPSKTNETTPAPVTNKVTRASGVI